MTNLDNFLRRVSDAREAADPDRDKRLEDLAWALTTCTGSTGATVTYERRNADGSLSAEATATVTRDTKPTELDEHIRTMAALKRLTDAARLADPTLAERDLIGRWASEAPQAPLPCDLCKQPVDTTTDTCSTGCPRSATTSRLICSSCITYLEIGDRALVVAEPNSFGYAVTHTHPACRGRITGGETVANIEVTR